MKDEIFKAANRLAAKMGSLAGQVEIECEHQNKDSTASSEAKVVLASIAANAQQWIKDLNVTISNLREIKDEDAPSTKEYLLDQRDTKLPEAENGYQNMLQDFREYRKGE